jgi:hypothetical protein
MRKMIEWTRPALHSRSSRLWSLRQRQVRSTASNQSANFTNASPVKECVFIVSVEGAAVPALLNVIEEEAA